MPTNLSKIDTTTTMGFHGDLKPSLNNEGGSKTVIYSGDVVSWEATTAV